MSNLFSPTPSPSGDSRPVIRPPQRARRVIGERPVVFQLLDELAEYARWRELRREGQRRDELQEERNVN